MDWSGFPGSKFDKCQTNTIWRYRGKFQWFTERKEKVILKRILSKIFPTCAEIRPQSVNSTRGAGSREARTGIQRHMFQDVGMASPKAYGLGWNEYRFPELGPSRPCSEGGGGWRDPLISSSPDPPAVERRPHPQTTVGTGRNSASPEQPRDDTSHLQALRTISSVEMTNDCHSWGLPWSWLL